MASIETILTLFILIAAGYLGKRTVLKGQSIAPLNSFVFFFAMPALLFSSAYKQPLESIFQPYNIAAFLLGAVLTAIICVVGCLIFFRQQSKEVLVLRALNGTFANYAYMGIPLVVGLLGDSAYAAMICIILAGNVFLIGGAQVLIECFRHADHQSTNSGSTQSNSFTQIWTIIDKSLLRSPVFLSILLGVSASALSLQLPLVLVESLDLMALATVPVALFCLGAGLEFKALRDSKFELVWLICIKLIVHPLVTWGVFKALGIDDPSWLLAAVLLTALPTGALAHVVAARYDICEKETSLCVVLSTLLSIVGVSIWVLILI